MLCRISEVNETMEYFDWIGLGPNEQTEHSPRHQWEGDSRVKDPKIEAFESIQMKCNVILRLQTV